MYNPYLPYLPATESLTLFAQSSASFSQLEALHAHAAVQHRIYDLLKGRQRDTALHSHNYTCTL
ncbi:hypothetical protein DPMN_008366 [Dreissena polymorpha]|uniref:Uncharacterized protein n=1 Tax=Dreissena polymorpha TaxID=45954 RepID=A0A9D4MV69_DREPO|nr:hypothetical protein DPMN_008366 [Dreissena polymorpha]